MGSRHRMEAELKRHRFCTGSQEQYLKCADQYVTYHWQSPERMGWEQVQQFLCCLSEVQGIEEEELEPYLAALDFLYRTMLKRPEVIRPMVKSTPKPSKDRSQIQSLFEAIRCPKVRTVLLLTCAARVSVAEACRLRIEDVDSQQMLLHVHSLNGRKRRTELNHELLLTLRAYWKQQRPSGPYLFPGDRGNEPLSRVAVYKVLRRAARDCGIAKVTLGSLKEALAGHNLIDPLQTAAVAGR